MTFWTLNLLRPADQSSDEYRRLTIGLVWRNWVPPAAILLLPGYRASPEWMTRATSVLNSGSKRSRDRARAIPAPAQYAITRLQQRARILPIAVRDCVGAHEGKRLDGERRIESAHAREGRAAHDEEVGDVPALAVAVDHRGLRIAAH